MRGGATRPQTRALSVKVQLGELSQSARPRGHHSYEEQKAIRPPPHPATTTLRLLRSRGVGCGCRLGPGRQAGPSASAQRTPPASQRARLPPRLSSEMRTAVLREGQPRGGHGPAGHATHGHRAPASGLRPPRWLSAQHPQPSPFLARGRVSLTGPLGPLDCLPSFPVFLSNYVIISGR